MKHRAVDREVVDCLASFVKKLNDESKNGALVVIEGRRDAEALRSIGFEGLSFMLCHKESTNDLVSEADEHAKIILLLDLDSKGKALTKRAAKILQKRKINVDLFFRRELAAATKGGVKRVEELARYKDHLQRPF